MAQISLYIDDTMASKLSAAARTKNCSVSKYVAMIVSQKLMDEDAEEYQKMEILKKLRGAARDPSMVEPPEIPWDHEITRRFDLL